mmetsp:Transcript_47080/g.131151  ORF Transcript_47080/g.131151 Transcript_47080/m.131151 type:complete len:87 (+) Transcript_47080:48-308(+)
MNPMTKVKKKTKYYQAELLWLLHGVLYLLKLELFRQNKSRNHSNQRTLKLAGNGGNEEDELWVTGVEVYFEDGVIHNLKRLLQKLR